MGNIEILKQTETEKGWQFEVSADGLSFSVSLGKGYWQEITGGGENAADLIKRAFEFLLERESKESILHSFDLSEIENYFPEFKEEMTL